MAKGTKTGGRNFQKGEGGRPRGVKSKVPQALMDALVKAMYRRDPEMIEKCLRAGLEADPPGSYQYLQLVMHYHVGKPTEKIQHSGQIGIAGEVRFYVPDNHRGDERE